MSITTLLRYSAIPLRLQDEEDEAAPLEEEGELGTLDEGEEYGEDEDIGFGEEEEGDFPEVE